jgi:hypothetical protein
MKDTDMPRWIPIGLALALFASPAYAIKSIGVSDTDPGFKYDVQDASQDPVMNACLPVVMVEQIFRKIANYSHGALLIISGDNAKKFVAVVNAIPPKTNLHADQVFISISEDPKYPNAFVRLANKGTSCGTAIVPATTIMRNLEAAFGKDTLSRFHKNHAAPVEPPVAIIPPTPAPDEGHVKPWDNSI